ncbi:MAG: MBL fold metallo-hydrolase [Pseudomonadota bacterium]
MRHLPVPGTHHVKVGNHTIVQILDGCLHHAPAQAFFGINAPQSEFDAYSAERGVSTRQFVFPVTVTLIRSHGRNILVDAGNGPGSRWRVGFLSHSLTQLGLETGDIDTVIISHMHPDHIGGLLDEKGHLVFANAQHIISRTECGYWLDGPPNGARTALPLELIEILGERLVLREPGAEVSPGVTLIDSAGHTPGHLCVAVESKNERLLIASDVANHPVWAIEKPDWHMSLDVDPALAATSRRRILGQVADEHWLMAATHMTFPALGRVERMGDGFRYLPIG